MSTIVISAIEKTLFDWVTANTSGQSAIIFANQNTPQPKRPYIALRLTSVNQIHEDRESVPDSGTGKIKIEGDRGIELEAQAYSDAESPTSMQSIEDLRSSLPKRSVRDQLATGGIVFMNWFPIVDLSFFQDEKENINRVQTEFSFTARSIIENVPGDIIANVIDLEGTIQTPAQELIVTQDITTP